MTSDARISTGLPGHPKTKKLIRRVGAAGAWHLVCLFLWTADNRSDGALTGMSDEDIELAVDWTGEEGAFVRELVTVGFLDGVEGERSIHDWEEHNPWAAGSDARSEKSRYAALCKQHGRAEAARKMPEYAARLLAAVPNSASGTATGTPVALPKPATGLPLAESGSAPSPSLSPSPSPSPKKEPDGSFCAEPESGSDAAALPTVVLIPLIDGSDFAVKAPEVQEWQQAFPSVDVVGELLRARIWCKDNPTKRKTAKGVRRFLSGWLGKEQDRGGSKSSPSATAVPLIDGVAWWKAAGFTHIAEAQNERCHLGNFREFRDGKRVPQEATA